MLPKNWHGGASIQPPPFFFAPWSKVKPMHRSFLRHFFFTSFSESPPKQSSLRQYGHFFLYLSFMCVHFGLPRGVLPVSLEDVMPLLGIALRRRTTYRLSFLVRRRRPKPAPIRRRRRPT